MAMNQPATKNISRRSAAKTDSDNLSYQVYINLQKIFRCLNIGWEMQESGCRSP